MSRRPGRSTRSVGRARLTTSGVRDKEVDHDSDDEAGGDRSGRGRGRSTQGFRPGVDALEGRALMTAVVASREFVIGLDSQVYGRTLDALGQPTGSFFLNAPGAEEVKDPSAAARLPGGGRRLFVVAPTTRSTPRFIPPREHAGYFKVVVTPVSAISDRARRLGRPLAVLREPSDHVREAPASATFTSRSSTPAVQRSAEYELAAYGGFVSARRPATTHTSAPRSSSASAPTSRSTSRGSAPQATRRAP